MFVWNCTRAVFAIHDVVFFFGFTSVFVKRNSLLRKKKFYEKYFYDTVQCNMIQY